MALQVLQLFGATLLTTGNTTLYQVPGPNTTPTGPASSVLKNAAVRFSNVSANAATVTAYAVQGGGTTGLTSDCFLNAYSIAPNSYLDIDVPMLGAGGFLSAAASATSAIIATALDGVLFS